MYAMVLDRLDDDMQIRPADVPLPVLAADDVLVRMAYASVNPADWKLCSGWMQRFEDFRPGRPFIPGFDGAGMIEQAPESSGFGRGDRVFVRAKQMIGRDGTFAEFTGVDLEGVAKVPDGLGLPAAATVGTAGLTAWQCVGPRGADLRPGQTLFVQGGSGGTGSFAVQFAKELGARVAASCSTANVSYLQGLGVDLAVDYRQGDAAERLRAWAPQGVDAFIDLFNLGSSGDPLALLKPGGVFVGVETLDASARTRAAQDGAARGVRVTQLVASRPDGPADMPRIGALMASGRVKAPQLEILPLDRAGEALRRLRSGHTRGKILLAIDKSLA
ncbi:NADP-dependent oxidoreductase [Phenylobacterium sp.]|jgi:NADPH:quinone reductase-like Zn-dependent oxidoreductase|uniref:NADP-dependent oxidoreductase n=1 Tax=Phenylobacterium sp. TaxID=1871053 RepID=UPI002F404B24